MNDFGPWRWVENRYWVLYPEGAARVEDNEIYDCDLRHKSGADWLLHVTRSHIRAWGAETIVWLACGMAAKRQLKASDAPQRNPAWAEPAQGQLS